MRNRESVMNREMETFALDAGEDFHRGKKRFSSKSLFHRSVEKTTDGGAGDRTTDGTSVDDLLYPLSQGRLAYPENVTPHT